MKRNKYTRAREGKFLFTIADINHFLDQIDKSGDCWLWMGCRNKLGYGSFCARGMILMTHVVSYLLYHGPIPNELDICHSCDNPQCVNPEHLWAGTHKENMDDRDRKGRWKRYKTHTMWGEQIGTSKLTVDKVVEIRRLHSTGESFRSMSEKYGVCLASIHKIVHNKTWKKINSSLKS